MRSFLVLEIIIDSEINLEKRMQSISNRWLRMRHQSGRSHHPKWSEVYPSVAWKKNSTSRLVLLTCASNRRKTPTRSSKELARSMLQWLLTINKITQAFTCVIKEPRITAQTNSWGDTPPQWPSHPTSWTKATSSEWTKDTRTRWIHLSCLSIMITTASYQLLWNTKNKIHTLIIIARTKKWTKVGQVLSLSREDTPINSLWSVMSLPVKLVKEVRVLKVFLSYMHHRHPSPFKALVTTKSTWLTPWSWRVSAYSRQRPIGTSSIGVF